jgi:hypothetical protein
MCSHFIKVVLAHRSFFIVPRGTHARTKGSPNIVKFGKSLQCNISPTTQHGISLKDEHHLTVARKPEVLGFEQDAIFVVAGAFAGRQPDDLHPAIGRQEGDDVRERVGQRLFDVVKREQRLSRTSGLGGRG